MSAEAATDGSILPAIAAVVGLPALVGVVALVDGYPVPQDPASAVGVLAGGFVLVVLGAAVAWLRTVGLLGAPVAAILGVLGGCGWALLSDGVRAVRVGDAVVLEGAPVLLRFVGVTPWLLLVVSGIAILEATARGSAGGPAAGPGSPTVGHLAALAYGLLAGLLVAVLSLLPGLLLGDLVTAPPLLLYAAVGGILGGTVIGYARLRHRIVTPILVVAVVAGAAAIAVTGGGSPLGFPMAWPVWVGLGVILGAIEGLARGIQGRVAGR